MSHQLLETSVDGILIIEAQEPYANTRKKDVVVAEDEPVTDVGEIKLQK